MFISKKKTCLFEDLLLLYIVTAAVCLEELRPNIKDICKLSNARFPDENHSVRDILQTYENCLKRVNEYPETIRESLVKELLYKLECFKEDLKQSYYAGNAQYSDIELVDNVKQEMQSKGINMSLRSLKLGKTKCNSLRSARSAVKQIIPLAVTGTLTEKQKACDAIFKRYRGNNITKMDIPTPKLDDYKDPKKLTVPLTNPSTYDINSPEAENALTQYYKVVMRCLTLTTEHKIQIFRFNRKFYDWLTQAVLPHLKDDKCYPAFGGVLRIVETMRQNDFVPKNATANFIFYRQKDMGKMEEENRKKQDCVKNIFKSSSFLMNLIPLILFILIVIVFVLWRSGRLVPWCCAKVSDTDSASTEIFYYPIEETPSVSLDLDDFASERSISQGSRSPRSSRQRAGDESKQYSLTYEREQESLLLGIPLKRHWSSKGSSSHAQLSPGKRQRPNY